MNHLKWRFYVSKEPHVESDEKKLKFKLLNNKAYSPENRPVQNTSMPTTVSITLTVIQIMDLDEQNQIMICMAQLAFVSPSKETLY